MADFRAEIPIRAFVNAKVIDYAENAPAFLQCVRDALDDFGCDRKMGYQFKNPAYIVGMLYCLVVVPKELWFVPENHRIYKILAEKRVVELFDITKSDDRFNGHPTYYLLHYLRNSISHANFAVDEAQDFVFWDQRGKSEPRHWEASIRNGPLFKFLSILGQEFRRPAEGGSDLLTVVAAMEPKCVALFLRFLWAKESKYGCP